MKQLFVRHIPIYWGAEHLIFLDLSSTQRKVVPRWGSSVPSRVTLISRFEPTRGSRAAHCGTGIRRAQLAYHSVMVVDIVKERECMGGDPFLLVLIRVAQKSGQNCRGEKVRQLRRVFAHAVTGHVYFCLALCNRTRRPLGVRSSLRSPSSAPVPTLEESSMAEHSDLHSPPRVRNSYEFQLHILPEFIFKINSA